MVQIIYIKLSCNLCWYKTHTTHIPPSTSTHTYHTHTYHTHTTTHTHTTHTHTHTHTQIHTLTIHTHGLVCTHTHLHIQADTHIPQIAGNFQWHKFRTIDQNTLRIHFCTFKFCGIYCTRACTFNGQPIRTHPFANSTRRQKYYIMWMCRMQQIREIISRKPSKITIHKILHYTVQCTLSLGS